MFVSQRATVLHADLDSFYASVERRDHPELGQRPVIVGAGVVLAATYEAKACGVKTAMGCSTARRLCPAAAFVRPRMDAYSRASRDVFAVFEDTAPLVEALSIDEAFLDVRGMERIAGTPAQIAARLRARVRAEVGLPITVGVARTKFLAKVASGVAKPDGLLVVEPERELEFLHPLPVERLWGVGRVTGMKLRARGIETVGQVAGIGEPGLIELLGRGSGRHLHALATGRDPRAVRPGRRRRSMGAQHALGRRAPKSWEALDATLVALVDKLARRLRAAQRVCRTVVLRLRFADYATRITRSHTIAEPTAKTPIVLAVARGLLATAMPLIGQNGITLIGVTLTNLEDDDAIQLVLPFTPDRHQALDAALDDIRERFGSRAITRAVLVNKPERQSVPLLPD
jgi:DNA polymerase IV